MNQVPLKSHTCKVDSKIPYDGHNSLSHDNTIQQYEYVLLALSTYQRFNGYNIFNHELL